MIPNPYLFEKVVQAHHEDLLRQAEQQRLLAHLPRYRESLARHLAGKLGVLLIALGTSLQRLEQRSKQAILDAPASDRHVDRPFGSRGGSPQESKPPHPSVRQGDKCGGEPQDEARLTTHAQYEQSYTFKMWPKGSEFDLQQVKGEQQCNYHLL